jgi:response regulator RpfG family c-di-GMP phosphodiesterase
MPGWAVWIFFALGIWTAVALAVALFFAGISALLGSSREGVTPQERARAARAWAGLGAISAGPASRRRILLVDDDPGLLLLLRTTLAAHEYAIEEAASAEEATAIARFWRPSLVVLDVNLPGTSGLTLCRELKQNRTLGSPCVIVLTGGETSAADARAAGADTLMRKPFGPLDLLDAIDGVLGGTGEPRAVAEAADSDQLLAYARDLSHVIQEERAQRRLVQHAYRQTVTAFTDALEARNEATGHHAVRVHRYALELTEAVQPSLLDDPSLEYGFLLHDFGKIGIPDSILDKPGPLSADELRVMQRHPLIGAELLAGVPLLGGEGLEVVRCHHERWDGGGYPFGLAKDEIPLGARLFAVADALDAMTSERPYRRPLAWQAAVDEILRGMGSQFDPQVVRAFALRTDRLKRTQHDLAQTA